MERTTIHLLPCARAGLLFALVLAGCTPDMSPNTYNAVAVQRANEAEQGVVVGVRQVGVEVAGTTGAVVGGAAGGIAGSQVGNGATSAFGALGGTLLGGLIGSGVEHATGDAKAYEYIVRRDDKKLVSVTQKDNPPLAVGQRVLVIAGPQARVVPDYTVKLPEPPEVAKKSAEGATVTPAPTTTTTPAAEATGNATPAAADTSPKPHEAPAAAAVAANPAAAAAKPGLAPATAAPAVSAAAPENPADATPAKPGPVNLLPALPGLTTTPATGATANPAPTD